MLSRKAEKATTLLPSLQGFHLIFSLRRAMPHVIDFAPMGHPLTLLSRSRSPHLFACCGYRTHLAPNSGNSRSAQKRKKPNGDLLKLRHNEPKPDIVAPIRRMVGEAVGYAATEG